MQLQTTINASGVKLRTLQTGHIHKSCCCCVCFSFAIAPASSQQSFKQFILMNDIFLLYQLYIRQIIFII